jgi:predicted alpha/beta hydrolase family esterase
LLRYITGRGGSGVGALSAYLKTLDDDYDVLPIDADFLQRDIQGQIDTVREFIRRDTANVVANSYGAYLLLLALIDQPPSNIRVLLLSPVLGRAISEERMLFSRPPREKTLHQAIIEQRLGMPDHLEIVTGQEDEICDPALARRIGEQLGISVSILASEGHMLEPSSVERALQRFLQE